MDLPTSALNMNDLSVKCVKLTAPPLNRIAEAILPDLLANFKRAYVGVIQCPNLTLPPFNLVSEGMSGDENVFDIGDLTNIFPAIKRDKLYEIKDLKVISGSDPLFVMGPCAGPVPFVGADNECVVNVKMTGDRVENGSHIITTTESSTECTHFTLPDYETRFSCVANFFTSNGLKGKVLKIECEIRKGSLNFFECIGEALAKHFGDEIVALGGVVLIESGKVKVHLFKPDLAKTPLKSNEELTNWLHFVELSAPSVGIGCIVSRDPSLNLRRQHFHLYSERGEGGHYHYDVEPDKIKYTGYFNVAKKLTKIDQTQENNPKD